MCPQSARITGCKVTLPAFVWLFSALHFQMCPRTVCPRRGKVTLVAFVWPFSTVCFKMFPQIACLKGCIITMIAFVCLFSIVFLNVSAKSLDQSRQSHIDCICLTFHHCAFSNVSSNYLLTLVAYVGLFSTVCFQMWPQITRLRGGIFTLVAFVILPITIKVISAMIKIHQLLHFDVLSSTASIQLTWKRKNSIKEYNLNFSCHTPVHLSKSNLWQHIIRMTISGGTLRQDNCQLISLSLIVLAWQAQKNRN